MDRAYLFTLVLRQRVGCKEKCRVNCIRNECLLFRCKLLMPPEKLLFLSHAAYRTTLFSNLCRNKMQKAPATKVFCGEKRMQCLKDIICRHISGVVSTSSCLRKRVQVSIPFDSTATLPLKQALLPR